MPIKTAQFKIQGMNRDNSESVFPEKFAFEINNMRIDARDDNTFLSLTNEKGNALCRRDDTTSSLHGNPLGYAVINNIIVLFTHSNVTTSDYIYKIRVNNTTTRFSDEIYFEGNLGFDENWKAHKPIETLAWYEEDNIQKVYWIDGIHQPRVANIALPGISTSNADIFDGFNFSRKLMLEETVQIQQGYSGQFHSGIVQYFITYYNKNASESKIAWQSPLFYVSFDDRGGSPEETIPKSFTLTIDNVDTNFEWLRLYCVQRTTLNGEVYVRKVQDFQTSENAIVFTDNGVLGELVDSTYLLYVGGDKIIPECFSQKDQVLFFGNIAEHNMLLSIPALQTPDNIEINTKIVPLDSYANAANKYYYYMHQDLVQGYENLDMQPTQGNETISTFKYLETYRFGVQFQFDNGQWSNVIYIGDKKIDQRVQKTQTGAYFAEPIIKFNVSDIPQDTSYGAIKRVRPVCVFPDMFERDVICQGILCPTVYNVGDRVSGRTFSYPSWFSRPFAPDNMNKVYDTTDPNNPVEMYPENHNFDGEYLCGIYDGTWKQYNNTNYPLNPYAIRTNNNKGTGCWAEFRHNYGIPGPQYYNGEIQMQFREMGGMIYPTLPAKSSLSLENPDLYSPFEFESCYENGFNIDQSIVTLYSPDIEFNSNIQNVSLRNAKLRIIGFVPLGANSGDIDIDASMPEEYKAYHLHLTDGMPEDLIDIPSNGKRPKGFYSEKVGSKILSKFGWMSLINGPYWQDKLYNPGVTYKGTGQVSLQDTNLDIYPITEWIKYGFIVYPWQQHGSLSNGNPQDTYSILKTKILSNLKYSYETIYFDRISEESYPSYGNDGYWTSANGSYDGNDTGLSDLSYVDELSHFVMLKSPYGNGQISYDCIVDKLLVQNKYDWGPSLAVYSMKEWTYHDNTDHYVDSDLSWYDEDNDMWHNWHPNLLDWMYYTLYAFSDPSLPTRMRDLNGSHTYRNWFNDDDWFLTTGQEREYLYNTPIDSYHVYKIWRDATSTISYFLNYDINTEQPISMKYKSAPHIVMALNNQTSYTVDNTTYTNLQRCLPVPYNLNSNSNRVPINSVGEKVGNDILLTFGDKSLYFDPNYNDVNNKISGCLQSYVQQAIFSIDSPTPPIAPQIHGGYWLAELYRDDVPEDSKFGGNTPEALENNIWHVCGPAVNINRNQPVVIIKCLEGDTFYQRYDLMKTMPVSDEDENQIIEIVSFMCESRINIDGRYDKQRGQDSAKLIIPEAYNKVNEVYSQLDNYITHNYIADTDKPLHHPNMIVWTGKKVNGEDVDIWTQIHMENYLDLEGCNGEIRGMHTFRNEIYAFQDTAIANVLYNSKTALVTEQGSPVQLASSGLVEGKQYVTNSMGCINKWSICETPIGLVFTDDLNKSIMVMGEGFENLSEKYGMSTWVQENTGIKPWDLSFPNESMITYYDRNNKDILFVTNDTALAYSIKLGAFTSFYSYGGVPFIINYKDKVIDVVNNNESTKLWIQNVGEYNNFFGVYEPFNITIIVNDNPTVDKIFNTVEYRADFFASNGNYEPNNTFSSIRAWNEYQDTYNQSISNITTPLPNNIKKKFRMWRLDIPRNYGTMDRIRNPWTYIKLEKDTQNYIGKVQLHDIQVHYTE